jgi:hypothetical protein
VIDAPVPAVDVVASKLTVCPVFGDVGLHVNAAVGAGNVGGVPPVVRATSANVVPT